MSGRRTLRLAIAAGMVASMTSVGSPVEAQTTSSAASAGCEALVQAANTGMAAQLKADNATIKQPASVSTFTCLGNFFNGVGLDVLTNGLNIASIAQAAMGEVCSALTTAWSTVEGTTQCGLTVTGLDANFNLGLGAGSFCPSLNFGGGGSTLLSSSTNGYGQTQWDVSGTTQLPDGYALVGNTTGLAVTPN
ncbi:hypothetical protein HLH33_10005 [Gluconacetobacter diazotrophicus]|uniref:Uncharacterized protein n=1 Tax=Gluconacetobacter diazotrophicus TaxID=33996 RepID=A0A7W4FF59_GLUDI|nr:hypothetical protein [Gluconacetobacter diazotrophicus]MBB2156638.1 hypothetical protein [Gluconacetobacter diazotrophicus]